MKLKDNAHIREYKHGNVLSRFVADHSDCTCLAFEFVLALALFLSFTLLKTQISPLTVGRGTPWPL